MTTDRVVHNTVRVATLPRPVAEFLRHKMQVAAQQLPDFNALRSCCKSLFTSDRDLSRRKRTTAWRLCGASDIVLCIAGRLHSPFQTVNGLPTPILNPGCLLSVIHHRAAPHATMCLQLMFPKQIPGGCTVPAEGALLMHKERFHDELDHLDSVHAQDDETMVWWIMSGVCFFQACFASMVLPRLPGATAPLDHSSALLYDPLDRSRRAFHIQFAVASHGVTSGAPTGNVGCTPSHLGETTGCTPSSFCTRC